MIRDELTGGWSSFTANLKHAFIPKNLLKRLSRGSNFENSAPNCIIENIRQEIYAINGARITLYRQL